MLRNKTYKNEWSNLKAANYLKRGIMVYRWVIMDLGRAERISENIGKP